MGYVTTDMGNAHCSGELERLSGRNAEVLKSCSQTAWMPKILHYKVPFPNSAKDPLSCFSSDVWFQGDLWWHMVHGSLFKFLLFALQTLGVGLNKTWIRHIIIQIKYHFYLILSTDLFFGNWKK